MDSRPLLLRALASGSNCGNEVSAPGGDFEVDEEVDKLFASFSLVVDKEDGGVVVLDTPLGVLGKDGDDEIMDTLG